MSERIEKAAAYHKKGYNCAQSVLCAYCDLFGLDEVTAFRISEGFGLGMGNMEGTCGALTAVDMLMGLKNSDGSLEAPKTKRETYKKVKELHEAFEVKNGSVICKELKGVDSGTPLRSCDGCIEDAARLVENILRKEDSND